MKVGFTGTRAGMTHEQKLQLHYLLSLGSLDGEDEFHHGGAVGADTEACRMAVEAGFRPVLYPARHDPLERNRKIVDACVVLLAAPKSAKPELRSGTWATIRYAQKVGRRIIMLVPVENNT